MAPGLPMPLPPDRLVSPSDKWAPTFPVMIEFPSLERARQWYDSPEYRPFKALRKAAGTYNAVFFEQLPPTH